MVTIALACVSPAGDKEGRRRKRRKEEEEKEKEEEEEEEETEGLLLDRQLALMTPSLMPLEPSSASYS